MATFYFYLNEKLEQQGPFNSAEIRQLIRDGVIVPTTHFRTDKMDRWIHAYNIKDAFPGYDPTQPTKPPAVPKRWGYRATMDLVRNPVLIIAILVFGIAVPLQLFRSFMQSHPSVPIQIAAPDIRGKSITELSLEETEVRIREILESDLELAHMIEENPGLLVAIREDLSLLERIYEARIAWSDKQKAEAGEDPEVRVVARHNPSNTNASNRVAIRWDSPLGELYQGIMGPTKALKPRAISLTDLGLPDGRFYLGPSDKLLLSPFGPEYYYLNKGKLYALPAVSIEMGPFDKDTSSAKYIPIGAVNDYSQISTNFQWTASAVRHRAGRSDCRIFYADLQRWSRIGQYNSAEPVRRGAELGPFDVYESDIQGREYGGSMGPLPIESDFQLFGDADFVLYMKAEFPPLALHDVNQGLTSRAARIVVCERIGDSNSQLRLYDAISGKPIGDPCPVGPLYNSNSKERAPPLRSLAFSYDGNLIVGLKYDGTLALFRAKGISPMSTISDICMRSDFDSMGSIMDSIGLFGPTVRMAVHPHRDLFLAYDDGDLAIVDLIQAKVIKRIRVPGMVRAYSWANSGRSIVAASTTGQVFRWSASTYELQSQVLLAGYGPWVVASNFSYDGAKLTAVFSQTVVGGKVLSQFPPVRYLFVWDLETPHEVVEMTDNHIRGHLKTPVHGLGSTYSGEFVAIHHYNSECCLAVALLKDSKLYSIPLSYIETGIEQILLLDSLVERPREFSFPLYPLKMGPEEFNLN